MADTLESGSSEALRLEESIKHRLGQIAFDEDSETVAQYVVLMICNHKPPQEITLELNGLFGDKFPNDFSLWVYNEAERIVTGKHPGNGQSNGQINGQSNDHFTNGQPNEVEMEDRSGDLEVVSQMSGVSTQNNTNDANNSIPTQPRAEYVNSVKIMQSPSSVPAGAPRFPAAARKLEIKCRSGVSKGPRKLGNHTVSKNFDRPEVRQKLYDDSNNIRLTGNERPNYNNSNSRPRRCRQWPHCMTPNCPFSHPSKPCFRYPNCPNPPGTCFFLHEGEDPTPEQVAQMAVALIAPLGGGPMGTSANFGAIPGQMNLQYMTPSSTLSSAPVQPSPQPPNDSITVCKYAERCANKSCVFGHANSVQPPSTKITVFEWCGNGVECKDVSCPKAHPSASKIRTPESFSDKYLETCKYLDGCTKWNCPFRHPRSPILCKNGAECKRQDCLFTHPISEDCRFGLNCAREGCLYKHPEGWSGRFPKGLKSHNWVNPSERKFAADEDEVMEKVIPGSVG